MLVNLFFICLIVSLFTGDGGRVLKAAAGLWIGIWIIGMVFGFGIRLIPYILLFVLVTRVIIPFMKGFLSSSHI